MLLWMCVGEIDVCVYESAYSLANEWNQKMCVCELQPKNWIQFSESNVQDWVCVIQCSFLQCNHTFCLSMNMSFQSVICNALFINFSLPKIAYKFEWAKIPLSELKSGLWLDYLIYIGLYFSSFKNFVYCSCTNVPHRKLLLCILNMQYCMLSYDNSFKFHKPISEKFSLKQGQLAVNPLV